MDLTVEHVNDNEDKFTGPTNDRKLFMRILGSIKTALVLRLVFVFAIIAACFKEVQIFDLDNKLIPFSDPLYTNDNGVHHYGLDSFSWHTNLSRTITSEKCEYMDVVFTWANGTDPKYIKEWERTARRKMNNYGKLRSTDHGTLRFAIRSIVEYVPFMRNIILITNNQVPSWIKKDNPKLRVLSTKDIFANKSHLPSFNSNAIESNLQNIPGLSECFLYFCDDFFMAKKVSLSDFVTDDGRPILFMSYDHVAPFTQAKNKKSKMWHKSIEISNDVFNKHYHPYEANTTMHYYADHIVYFFRKSALDYMHKIWDKDLEKTSAQKFRSENDMVISYLHHNMLLEEGAGVPVFDKGKTIRWTNDHKRNKSRWNKVVKNDNLTGFCIQDEFKYSKDIEEIENESKYLIDVLCSRFPTPSPFEKDSNPCKVPKTKKATSMKH